MLNISVIRRVLGNLLIVLGLAMLPSLAWSLYFGENDVQAFIYSIILTIGAGIILKMNTSSDAELGMQEGLIIVTLGWVLAAIFGAFPFIFSGAVDNFISGFFEAVSGFTTTGATNIPDVEILPHGILFWRSFTHWLGGMGIIVLFLAILPQMGAGGFHLFKAEVPGPSVEKVSSRTAYNAKVLYLIYAGITIIQTVLLMLSGFSFFDALIHTFGSVATGGYSNKNLSISAFNNPAAEIIILVFMFISGGNFSLYYYLLKGQWEKLFKDEEFRFYCGVTVVSTLLIAWNIRGYISSTVDLLRTSAFQVISIMTTTGYVTANFDAWPDFSRLLLLLLMFFGGCAGSTAGAIKHIRLLVLFKHFYRSLVNALHPKAVMRIKVNGKVVSEQTLRGIMSFTFAYIALFIGGSLVMTFLGMDVISAVSAVAACIGNIGPGLARVGPMFTFHEIPSIGKLLLSILMLLGRLEIFTIIVCLTPEFWKGIKVKNPFNSG